MFRINSERVCPFQFYGYRNLDKVQNYSFIVIVIENLYMTSKNLPGDHQDESFGDCTWLAGTAFQTKEAKDVFKDVFKILDNTVKTHRVMSVLL